MRGQAAGFVSALAGGRYPRYLPTAGGRLGRGLLAGLDINMRPSDLATLDLALKARN
jgi:hypothetical protein